MQRRRTNRSHAADGLWLLDRVPPEWRIWLGAAALAVLVAVVYWPTLQASLILDDLVDISDNVTMRSLGGLFDIWFKLGSVEQYYPLTYSTFWLEYQLWGLDPRGYHAVNFLLHAVAAVLAWRLLVRLKVPGAWFAAALFAVHPVEVESVALVYELKNVLSCALGLAALLAYLRFAPADEPAGATPPSSQSERRLYYALALALYVAALLSKSVAVTVPPVLLVIYWWKRGRLTWKDVVPTLPFFAVGLVLGSVTLWLERTFVLGGGATGQEWDLSPVDRVLVAGRALCFYVEKLLWPHPLLLAYPRWKIDSRELWQYAYPAVALAVLVALWFARKRLGRGPLAAALIFAGVLSPGLGFFNVFYFRLSYVADHFQYHASIALLALAAAGAVLVARRLPRTARWWWRAACGAVLVVLVVVAHQRTRLWKDAPTVWATLLEQDPQSLIANRWTAVALRDQGKYTASVARFRAAVDTQLNALRDYPDVHAYQDNLAQCYVDLAHAQKFAGQRLEAIQSHEAAAAVRRRLVRNHPEIGKYQRDLAASQIDLAVLDQELDRKAEAVARIRQAIAILDTLTRNTPATDRSRGKYQNDLATDWTSLGIAERGREQPVTAAEAFRKAIELREDLVSGEGASASELALNGYRDALARNYVDLSELERQASHTAEALAWRRKSLALRQQLAAADPQATAYQFAVAVDLTETAALERTTGKPAAAELTYQEAVALLERLAEQRRPGESVSADDDDNHCAAVLVDLGVLERELGKQAEAERSFRKSIQIRERLVREHPRIAAYQEALAGTYANLGVTLLAKGQPSDAVDVNKKVVATREQLVRDNPGVAADQEKLGWAYANLGVAQVAAGALVDAEASHRKAVNTRAVLVQDYPAADDYKHEIALSCRDLGDLLRNSGRMAEAVVSYQTAVDIHKQLAADYPDNLACRVNLLNDLGPCADAMARAGQWTESAATYADAVRAGDSTWRTAALQALAQLAAGNAEGYRGTCAELVARHGATADPAAAWMMALTLALGQQSLADLQPALALAERARKGEPNNPLTAVVAAAVGCRASRPEATIVLAESLDRLAAEKEQSDQAFITRLLGEMILARAASEGSDRAVLEKRLTTLRESIAAAGKIPPSKPVLLPAWATSAVVAIAQRELDSLAAPASP